MPIDLRAAKRHRKELKRKAKRRGIAKSCRKGSTGGKIHCSSMGGQSSKMWLTSLRRGILSKLRARVKREAAERAE